ncbi:MAG: hypothetical protein ABSF56_02945 [Minisyncoccia bacterium]|jgi:hypothetical protein
MKKYAAGNRGLIKMILIVVIALLILSYFNINLRQLVNAPTTQDNVSYVASSTVTIWDSYLKVPATYLWNNVFIDLIWNPAITNLTNMKNGEPTNISTSSPTLPSIPLVQ